MAEKRSNRVSTNKPGEKAEEMIKNGQIDISSCRQAEEASLGQVIDSIPDGIFILDKNGNIVFSNPAAQNMLKREKSGLIGKSFGQTALEKMTELEILSEDGKTRTLEMRTVEVKWKNKSCNLAILRDVTERKEAERRVMALSHRLIHIQEKERREIGHALHDEVGGSLTILKLALSQAQRRQGEEAMLAIKEINQIVDELVNQVRYISHTMRPSMLDDYGLLEALKWYVEQFRERTGININFTHGILEGRLPAQIETAAYRMVQEALTNAAKYSGAKCVDIALSCDKGILNMSIKDEGCGFDPQEISTGTGLMGMQDLAILAGGSLTVYSSPGEGTYISCELPVERRQ